MAPPALTAHYRVGVASRVIGALLGVYALTSVTAAAIALLLRAIGWASPVDAVLIATLTSLLIYCIGFMAVFRARSAARAWMGLALACLPATVTVLALWATGHR